MRGRGLTWLPSWLRTYDRRKAVQDGLAGMVVTMLLVPQSLAYAMLAGCLRTWACTPPSCPSSRTPCSAPA